MLFSVIITELSLLENMCKKLIEQISNTRN